MELHVAPQPAKVDTSFDFHSIRMMPVVDVTGPGRVEPECSSKTVLQSMTVEQLLTVTTSNPFSVANEVNLIVTEVAPGGAITPDIDSELTY